jgi:hypothetical protein
MPFAKEAFAPFARWLEGIARVAPKQGSTVLFSFEFRRPVRPGQCMQGQRGCSGHEVGDALHAVCVAETIYVSHPGPCLEHGCAQACGVVLRFFLLGRLDCPMGSLACNHLSFDAVFPDLSWIWTLCQLVLSQRSQLSNVDFTSFLPVSTLAYPLYITRLVL